MALKANSNVLGRIDYPGQFLGKTASNHLANPIRHWFQEHPEEIAPENYFSATFQRKSDGRYRCFLELIGKHHWTASEEGSTLPYALRNSLQSALPDIQLSDGGKFEL